MGCYRDMGKVGKLDEDVRSREVEVEADEENQIRAPYIPVYHRVSSNKERRPSAFLAGS